MDELSLCNICTEEFDDDPSIRPSDGMTSRLPIQSARCSHTSSICYSCIMSIKRNKAVEENKDPCKIKWLGCPDCRKKTCFNTEDLIVDIGRCATLRLLRNKSDGSSNTSSNIEPSDGGGESPASRQTSNENQLNIESQSTETHIESDEESRFSTVEYGTPARTDEMSTSSTSEFKSDMSGSKDTNGFDEEDAMEMSEEDEKVLATTAASLANTQQSSSELNLRRSKRRKVNTEGNSDRGDDNSDAVTVSNEEGSITNEQNDSVEESGSDGESISGGDKEDDTVLEEEESVVGDEDEDTSTMANIQLYKIGTKVSKVFFDELEGKLRPYIGTITSYDPKTMYYKVIYDEDGDAEDLFASGVKEILVESVDEDTSTLSLISASESQERQVSARMTTRRQSQRRQSQQNVVEQKLLVTAVNGKTYSGDTVDDIDDDNEEDDTVLDEDAKQWMKEMSKSNLNVYRIRCYNKIAATDEDPFARKTAQWCVNNGNIATCAEIAKILPKQQRHDGEALKQKVLSVNLNTLKDECQQAQDYNCKKEGDYILSYRQFIEIKKGDVIALHTKGGYKKGDPPQTLTFGVVQDNSLNIIYKEDAIQKHGFPWNFCDPGKSTTNRLGLMMKKVQWYRQGKLRAVRGSKPVHWLSETETKWMGKVGVSTEIRLTQAIRNMSSKKFLKNTHAIDNQWTMN